MGCQIRYRGILRVIFIIRGTQQNFTRGALIARWEGDYNKRSATLTHFKPLAYATDKPDSRNNSASALIATVNNDLWAWADFPMAYDPTIVPISSELLPRIVFTLIATTESQVVLKGAGTGINGQPEDVQEFLTASGNGSVALTGALPSEQSQVGTSTNLGNLFTKAVATAEKWEKFVDVAENATDYFLTGGTVMPHEPFYWVALALALIAGFLVPLPYNYWKLKKFNKACH